VEPGNTGKKREMPIPQKVPSVFKLGGSLLFTAQFRGKSSITFSLTFFLEVEKKSLPKTAPGL
jgi:hypothetical protein